MASGGARNRSGPQPSESSLTSAKRGLAFRTLDSAGYSGKVPEFPLTPLVLFDEYYDGEGKSREKVKERDEGATLGFREREAAIWATVWTYPQAIAWAEEPWRHETIAEFCRLKATIEFEPGSNASLVGQMHRYRDQIGLSPAGLKENGWKIGVPSPAEDRPVKSAPRRSSSKARLKVVSGGGG